MPIYFNPQLQETVRRFHPAIIAFPELWAEFNRTGSWSVKHAPKRRELIFTFAGREALKIRALKNLPKYKLKWSEDALVLPEFQIQAESYLEQEMSRIADIAFEQIKEHGIDVVLSREQARLLYRKTLSL